MSVHSLESRAFCFDCDRELASMTGNLQAVLEGEAPRKAAEPLRDCLDQAGVRLPPGPSAARSEPGIQNRRGYMIGWTEQIPLGDRVLTFSGVLSPQDCTCQMRLVQSCAAAASAFSAARRESETDVTVRYASRWPLKRGSSWIGTSNDR